MTEEVTDLTARRDPEPESEALTEELTHPTARRGPEPEPEALTEEVTDPSVEPSKLVDEIELELHFEVGQTRMAVGQLKTLQPGYVFELETTTAAPVAVRASGRAIGRGELVQIAGRVGVKLVEVHGRDG